MRSMPATVVIVLAFALAAPARAGDTWENQIRAQIFRGDIKGVIKVLEGGALEGMASEPALLLRTAKTLDEYAYGIVRHDGKAAQRLFDLLTERTAKVRDAQPDDATAREAWAYFAATRARSRLLLGSKKAQPEWVEAADVLLALNTRADSTRAAGWLAAAAACRAANEQELLGRARDVLSKAWEKEGDAPRKAAALARGHAERADALIQRKALGAAKVEIAAGIKLLAPHEADVEGAVAEAREVLASLNHRKKLKVKGAAFKTRRVVSGDSTLVVDVPASPRWKVKRESNSRIVLSLRQLNARGEAIRSIKVVVYKWGSTLPRLDGSTVSTENTKALAEGMFSSNAEVCGIAEILRQKKPKKTKLHKTLTDAYRSSLAGLDEDDKWRSFQVYWFRSKQRRRTYQMTVADWVDVEYLDGSAAFVLAKLRANVK